MTRPLIQTNEPALPLDEPVLDPAAANNVAPAAEPPSASGPRPWPFDHERLASLLVPPRPARVLLWDEDTRPRR